MHVVGFERAGGIGRLIQVGALLARTPRRMSVLVDLEILGPTLRGLQRDVGL
jgi:hypothetical protein